MRNVYKENGYSNRDEYLHALADEFDMPYEAVQAAAYTLGASEDFDALVTEVSDAACVAHNQEPMICMVNLMNANGEKECTVCIKTDGMPESWEVMFFLSDQMKTLGVDTIKKIEAIGMQTAKEICDVSRFDRWPTLHIAND